MKKLGFSLLELSVVLVVIGVLVAAVSGSSKLIANSKLRKAIQEIESTQSSVHTFYAAFEAYPGDFAMATNFFTDVENGNADNLISYNPENAYAWLHMERAKIVGGSFSGVMEDNGNGSEAGINSQASRYSANACFNFIGNLSWANDLNIIAGRNNLLLGGRWYDNACLGQIFLPRDAEFLDLKLDDGSPIYGNVRAAGGQVNPATSNSSGVANFSTECIKNDKYNTIDDDRECILTFLF